MDRVGNTFGEDLMELKLLDFLSDLLSNWYKIVIVSFVAAIVGLLISTCVIVPKYEASVNMIVNTAGESAGVLTNDNVTSSRNMVSTYAIIIKGNTVLDEVISQSGTEISYDELYSIVDVKAINSTQIMKVSVRYHDPEAAFQLVSLIAEIAPDIIVDAVEAGSCKMVSKVSVGQKPVTPNVLQNTAISAAIGFCLAILVLTFKLAISNTLLSSHDVERYLQINVIGVIPDIREVSK